MPILISYSSDCPIPELSLERAARLAPPEFQLAWTWFQRHEGQVVPKLPHRMEEPTGVPFPITADRGIHSPDDRHFKGSYPPGRKYALSIHSQGKLRYDDKPVIWRPDGTWMLDYQAHVSAPGKNQKWSLNDPLLNCMNDGIPVGVLVKRREVRGYDVLGLAFVESFNAKLGTFTLHGPVNTRTEFAHAFSTVVPQELTAQENAHLEKLIRLAEGDGDERVRLYLDRVVRNQQERFRVDIMSAYQGACAISGTSVPDVLQAAHIDRYRGRKSQTVQNGVLLRADLHILYDANILSITPDHHKVMLAGDVLLDDEYARFDGQVISMPRDARLRPDDRLLDMHHQQFKALWQGAA